MYEWRYPVIPNANVNTPFNYRVIESDTLSRPLGIPEGTFSIKHGLIYGA